jgi:type IV pilus assembly protein PilP
MRNILIAGCVALFCAGCTKPMDELESYLTRVKQAAPPPIEPLPPMRSFKTHAYVPTRDPFLTGESEALDAAVEEEIDGGPDRPDMDRPRELLESFPLDALDMVGTLGGGDAIEALVKDPDGVVHRVRAGNWMGQNHGQIQAIYEDSIALEERMQDPTGRWERRSTSIALEDIK